MKRMLAALTLALLMAFSALAASLPQDTGQSGKSEIPSMILALNLKESQKKNLNLFMPSATGSSNQLLKTNQ